MTETKPQPMSLARYQIKLFPDRKLVELFEARVAKAAKAVPQIHVADEPSAKLATTALGNLKRLLDDLTEIRRRSLAPFKDAQDQIRGWADPLVDQVRRLSLELRQGVLDHQQRLKDEAREQQEAAEAAVAAEAKRKREEAERLRTDAEAERKLGGASSVVHQDAMEQAALNLEQQADTAEAIHVPEVVVPTKTRGAGASTGTRKTWKYEIVSRPHLTAAAGLVAVLDLCNATLNCTTHSQVGAAVDVIAGALEMDLDDVVAAAAEPNLRYLKARTPKGKNPTVPSIPGVRFYQDESLAVRTR